VAGAGVGCFARVVVTRCLIWNFLSYIIYSNIYQFYIYSNICQLRFCPRRCAGFPVQWDQEAMEGLDDYGDGGVVPPSAIKITAMNDGDDPLPPMPPGAFARFHRVLSTTCGSATACQWGLATHTDSARGQRGECSEEAELELMFCGMRGGNRSYGIGCRSRALQLVSFDLITTSTGAVPAFITGGDGFNGGDGNEGEEGEDNGGEEEDEFDGEVDVLPDFANEAAVKLHKQVKHDQAEHEKVSAELAEIQAR